MMLEVADIERVFEREDTRKKDRLAHVRDHSRTEPHGLCGSRLIGIPARPGLDLCIVCKELAMRARW